MTDKPSEQDASTYKARFGKLLRTKREDAGLSAKELADVLGMGLRDVYAWETGTSFPNAELLPDLAKALGCKSIHEILPPQ